MHLAGQPNGRDVVAGDAGRGQHRRIAATAPSHHRPGACSLQPGCGHVEAVLRDADPDDAPRLVERTALVAVVETSIPRTSATSVSAACRPSPAARRPSRSCRLTMFSSSSWWPGRGLRVDARRRRPSPRVGSSDSPPSRIAAPELAVPAGIALVPRSLEVAALDQIGGDEQRAGERVEAADVGVEEVGPVACSGGAAWRRS